MNVAIIGTGYVGLVTGAGLATIGHDVVCIDSDIEKIAALTAGQVPFHEPGLPQLVAAATAAGRLRFTDSLDKGILAATIIMLAVGTPSNGHGEADLSALNHCAQRLADTITHSCLVVIKSTVPPGTCDAVQAMFDRRHPQGRSEIRVASNPEFLAEGSAVRDFLQPARIVIGADNRETAELLAQLYAPLDVEGTRRQMLDLRTAEYSKYACNAMLAARVSMVNELAAIAAACGADIPAVFEVVGSDPRIGDRYLRPGPGFGGSCLPKDVRALRDIAARSGETAPLLECIEHTNADRVERLTQAISDFFHADLRGRRIAVWGLAFKPGTDDVRESPALRLIHSLLQAGVHVQAFDPAVRCLPQLDHCRLVFHTAPAYACRHAELLCVMTAWPEFRHPDWAGIAARMKRAAVFDPHFLYDAALLQRAGLQHLGSGNRSTKWTYSGRHFSDSTLHRLNSSSAVR